MPLTKTNGISIITNAVSFITNLISFSTNGISFGARVKEEAGEHGDAVLKRARWDAGV